jgi:outer membrane protein OmpA-like peptidoglycan-associated protein
MKIKIFTLLALFLVLFGGLKAQDVPGSKDHPLITRYPGSVIKWYDESNFKPYSIATGPVTSYRHIDDWVKIEGKVTRIYYELQGQRTMSEVYKNYLSAVKNGGFEVISQGLFQERNVKKDIGGSSWLLVQYNENPTPTNSNVMLLQGSSDTQGGGYLAGKLKTADGTVYVSIGGHQYKGDVVVFLVDIIEVDELEDGLIFVDAKAMGNALDREGKVAIYDIKFDYDKTDFLPASKPVIAEIAKLLKERPALKLYVVGHTDMKGGLDYNLRLSDSRAKSVVNSLVNEHGIAASRLTAKGVGPLAPLGSNDTDQGRARNRRVELVKQ